MPAEIVKNTVVTLKYTVRDGEGELIDDGHEPLVYLHGGYDGIFPKLEETLHGRKEGEQLTVRLQPHEAFGDYDEELVLLEDISQFPEDIEVGMSIERIGDEGEEDELYHITDIADGKVVIDGNHPLAGRLLVFDLTIDKVRPATEAELKAGEAHTAHHACCGGHDHDHDHGDHHHHGHDHGHGGCGGGGHCGCGH